MPKLHTTKTKNLDKRSAALQSEPQVSSFCPQNPGAKRTAGNEGRKERKIAVSVALPALPTGFAGPNALHFPLVATFFAGSLMFFQSVHASYLAADRSTARVATIAAVSAIGGLATIPLPGPTKPGDTNVLGLHEPAVFFHFLLNAFGTANQLATVVVASVAATTGVLTLATCRGHLLVCLSDRRSNESKCRGQFFRKGLLGKCDQTEGGSEQENHAKPWCWRVQGWPSCFHRISVLPHGVGECRGWREVCGAAFELFLAQKSIINRVPRMV